MTGIYTSVRFGETLYLEGCQASIGTVGDAFDSLAETTIGLYKHECSRADSPFCKDRSIGCPTWR